MISIDLSGRNALITGGTRGIGRAISRRLAEAGASTTAVYRNDAGAAEQSLAERRAISPAAVHRNRQADIGDAAQVDTMVDHVRADFPEGLDFLILNAATGLGGTVQTADLTAWQRLVDVNLTSTVLLVRGLQPILRRGGAIVAIGSGAGHDPIPGLALYGAAKAGLNMLIADLAFEVGPAGIRANVVSPGSTDTSFHGPAPSPRDAPASPSNHNALQRRGGPDDVAGVVLLLCSDLAGFVTGQAIRVNGAAL